MEGLSGKIKFDGAGFRSDFQLDIVELKREGLVQVSSGKKYFKSYKNICRSALGTRAMEPISPVTTRKYPTRLWRVFITRLWLSPPSWWVQYSTVQDSTVQYSLHNKTLIVSTIVVSSAPFITNRGTLTRNRFISKQFGNFAKFDYSQQNVTMCTHDNRAIVMQCTVQNHLMLTLVLSSECSVSDAERKERNLDWKRSLRGIQRGPHIIHLGNTRSDM